MKNDKSVNAGSLPLAEDFYSLQGEGGFSGTAAYFIRLAGCDVGCRWCDSEDSRNASAHAPVPVAEIVRRVADCPAKIVVITGGEPLMHRLDELTDVLREAGKTIHLETSGTHPLSGKFDRVCLSPKRHRPPLDEMWAEADELKVVIAAPDDLSWAEECAAKVWERAAEVGECTAGMRECAAGTQGSAARAGKSRDSGSDRRCTALFLQPEWSGRETVVPIIVEHIKSHPYWRLSLQTHKYIGIE